MAKENVAENIKELKMQWNSYGNDMIEKSGQMDSEPVFMIHEKCTSLKNNTNVNTLIFMTGSIPTWAF